jgi:hypothetical protein
MARVDLAITEIAQSGVYPSGTTGQADGHKFSNSEDVFLEVVNGNGSTPRNVIFPTPAERAGLAVADLTVTIPAAARRIIGPFEPSVFNQGGADQGKTHINYQAGGETDLTVRAFRFPS